MKNQQISILFNDQENCAHSKNNIKVKNIKHLL